MDGAKGQVNEDPTSQAKRRVSDQGFEPCIRSLVIKFLNPKPENPERFQVYVVPGVVHLAFP